MCFQKIIMCWVLLALLSLTACVHRPLTKRTWNGSEYHKNSLSQQNAAHKMLENYKFRGDERVLDVGCGDGKITAQIAQQVPKGSVVGVDNSEPMIEFGKKEFGPDKVPNLKFILKDAANLDYVEQFDLIVSFSAMHWVMEQEKALKAMFKSLKPGGKLLVSMPDGYPEALVLALADVIAKEKWHPYFAAFKKEQIFFTPETYMDLLKKAGFGLIETERVPMFDDFPSKETFGNFIRQWLPYLRPVPVEKRDEFMAELLERYVKYGTTDARGHVAFFKYTLEAQADKG